MSHDEVDVHSEHNPDEVRALIETLKGMIELEEGELYTLRKGILHHVQQRNEDNGLRRIRVMEEAYDAAYAIAKRLRKTMRGYRPDPALVISALVMHGASQEGAEDIARAYLYNLFTAQGETSAS